jgi:hypothetical protein
MGSGVGGASRRAPRAADRGRRVDRDSCRRACGAARLRAMLRPPETPGGPGRALAVAAMWGIGCIAVGPAPTSTARSWPPATRSTTSPHRRRRRPGHARADRRPHSPRLRRDPRGGVADAQPAAPAISKSSPPAAGSSPRWPRPEPRRTDELAAGARRPPGRDARQRHHHRRGQVRLRAGQWPPSCASSKSSAAWIAEGPVQLVPTYLGAHAVPAEYPRSADGTDRSAVCSRHGRRPIAEQLPAVAGQGDRPLLRRLLREDGVFSPGQSRPRPRAAEQ